MRQVAPSAVDARGCCYRPNPSSHPPNASHLPCPTSPPCPQVYRGARKGRGLVVSPKDYSTKYRQVLLRRSERLGVCGASGGVWVELLLCRLVAWALTGSGLSPDCISFALLPNAGTERQLPPGSWGGPAGARSQPASGLPAFCAALLLHPCFDSS